MNDIKIEIPEREYDKECIICFEDISNNKLEENKYCGCKFTYHENCYEKWLVYIKLTPASRRRRERMEPYKCILCRDAIDINIDLDKWLKEGSEGFKE